MCMVVAGLMHPSSGGWRASYPGVASSPGPCAPGGSSLRIATAGRARAEVGAVRSEECERQRDKGSEDRASILDQ